MRMNTGEYGYNDLNRRGPSLSFLVLVLAVFAVFFLCITGGADADSQISSIDMTDAAHSNTVDPDYSTVFPDDRVNTLTITISPDNWQTMLENMTELYGEFGGGSAGGVPGQRGGNSDEGQRMGGLFSSVDPVYVPADITFDGAEWKNVGVRLKGFNSLQGSWGEGSYKISLKLNFDKFEDEYPEIKNQRFYGFDELNLQNNYNDDSLMRDMVVPAIFRESGVAAPYTAFYRVYVDYGQGPIYFGLYTMVEAVEDTVIKTQFADDSGNLYKPEGNGATFASGTFDTGSFEKKTNEDEADWSDVEELYKILNSDTRTTNPEQWRAELEAVFDVDVFLRWLATNTVIQNWDTYGGNSRNFYLYTNPANGKITWIPWDNNYALSNGMSGGDQGGIPAGGNISAGNWSWQPGTDQAPTDGMPGGGRIPAGNTSWQPVGSMIQPGWVESGAATGNRAVIEGQLPGKSEAMTGGGSSRNNTWQSDRNSPSGGVRPEMDTGNQNPGDMNAGGMGSTLSLSLDEVSDNWPLIRYLADDPVYYARYQDYLEMVVTTSFEPSKTEETYRYYHALIEPYVTGSEGEQAGYTNLKSAGSFDASLNDLIDHVNSRYEAVMAFLSGNPTPTPTPTQVRNATATPPPTLTQVTTATGTTTMSKDSALAALRSGESITSSSKADLLNKYRLSQPAIQEVLSASSPSSPSSGESPASAFLWTDLSTGSRFAQPVPGDGPRVNAHSPILAEMSLSKVTFL